MGKKKLIHFRENLTFPHLFQPTFQDLAEGFRMQSQWKTGFFRNANPIILELGCGKGEYTVGLATRYPDSNFIGIDWKGARLWRGCKTVSEQQMNNVAFVRTQIGHVTSIFGKDEVSEIWITFPDPQRKKERLRLTSPGFLEKYREILAPGGIIHLKTDDGPFFDYTMEVIHGGGHRILWSTGDLYNSGTTEDVATIRTYYEQMWLGMGKKICYVKFQLCNP